MDHPRPQTPQGESVAKFGTPLLIILNAVCKSHIEKVRGNLSNQFFVDIFRGQKHPMGRICAETMEVDV